MDSKDEKYLRVNTGTGILPVISFSAMEMKNNHYYVVLFLFFSLNDDLCHGRDTITATKSLSFGETLVSSGGKFELGFFRPGNSSKYYLGIWYKDVILSQTSIWVANRDKPIDYGAAKLTISQGNLVILDIFQGIVWSAPDGNINRNISVTAVLRDDGNLILSDMSNSSTPLLLWQSFDHPTHTFLPGAKLGYDKHTQRKHVLISWKNSNDPAPGLYSLEMDPKLAQFVIKWNRTREYWASGSWNGHIFTQVPEMRLNYIFNYSYIDNENESYFTYSLYIGNIASHITSMLIMDVSGQIKQQTWLNGAYQWNLFWSQPREVCEVYAKCGAFGAQTNAKKSMKVKAILSSTAALMFLLIGSISYIYYRRRRGAHISHRHKAEREAKALMNGNSDEAIDVPYFHFETILAATDNFSNANKLGQGGFGPVYKGIFPGGKEIAVKTLSSHSGQGIAEFKNEVTLIAKLQHINLVRLLGYCINATKQILLYEYMPNKSLDTFIFDGTFCQLLDWKKRYDIILGIARGLSYLHHDSRLRIIHRDLKTSNILLDEEMNPKISDFGLARIVEGKVTEANTKKVVGTYGYMSPEYALDGLFSIKSDVFSFGVVVLEIISGRRNTGFYQSEEALNLLGYVSEETSHDLIIISSSDRKLKLSQAWKLWTEKAEIQLIDESLLESCNRSEAIKCINVALLCVQEDPSYRPNMSDVIVMLVGEGINLPTPNRPAFVTRTHASGSSSSSSNKKYIVSNNQVTITVEEGR